MDTHCISLAWWMTEIYLLVKCFYFDRVHVLETIKWNALHLKRMVDISIQVYIIVNWSMCIVEYHICAYGFFFCYSTLVFSLYFSPLWPCWMQCPFHSHLITIKWKHSTMIVLVFVIYHPCDATSVRCKWITTPSTTTTKIHTKNYVDIKMMRTDKK